MAPPILVGPKLDAGRRLLEALDQTPVQPFAAFWLWEPEAEEWRLVIGSELVRTAGPSATLTHIQQVLRPGEVQAEGLSLLEIVVVGPRDRRLDLLRGVPQSGRAAWSEPLPISGALVGGQFVEGAYVYRNRPPTPDAMEVITEATKQASSLLNHGQTPRVIEVGQEQNTALRRAGVTGDTLVITAPVGLGPSFVLPGEPYPVTEARRLELRIKRVPRASRLQVAA